MDSMADARGVSCSSDVELKSKVAQLAARGVKLSPTSKKATQFLKLDSFPEASGVKIDEGSNYSRLRASLGLDEEVDKLDFNELYQECKESQARLVSTQRRLLKDSKKTKELEFIIDGDVGEIRYESLQDLGDVVDNACGLINQKLSAAKPEEEGKFERFARKLRQGFRGFCRNAENIEPFLEFIPEALGAGSALFGALTVVIKVAGAYQSLDDLVCKALENIRSIADSSTNLVLGAMPNSKKLHMQMSTVYACVFGVLRLASERVFQGRWKKVGLAITHPKNNGDELNSLRLAMMEKHRSLEVTLLIVNMGQINKTVAAMSRSEMEQKVNQFWLAKEIHDLLVANGSLRPLKKDKTKRLVRGKSSKKLPRLNVDDLLLDKLFPTTLVEDDCLELSSSESLPGRRDHHRVKAVTGNNQLQAFIKLETEKILMILGGMGGRDDQLSPVSHVVAKLITALREVQQRNQSMLTVTFFCGQHQYDGYSSCRAMMITLILQLIDQYRDFSNEILNECMQSLEARDVTGLCDLYEALCFELPETAILYCTIDGLGFFGYPNKRLSETRMILGRLLDLSRDIEKSPKACIKFLCATPALCPDMADLFELRLRLMSRPKSYLARSVSRLTSHMALRPVSQDPYLVWMYGSLAVVSSVTGCTFHA
ncbi:hypothetical protein PG999_012270 [Apiospora kogelbergensis]|uniref:Nephrocystin 3-like N-terminal domain-containing protein n=1 Tax=Apiospora kogelbergensis TaxID=1337665 RepID=A0AAW0QHR0_9PEZI